MRLKEQRFKYANERLKTQLEKTLNNLRYIFEGRYVLVSEIVSDRFGSFSEGDFDDFLDKLINMYEWSKKDYDYIRTLLYVTIRAMQAGLRRTLVPKDIDAVSLSYNPAVNSDSFENLFYVFSEDKTHYFSNSHNREIRCTVSPDMAATIQTVYTMLSGITKEFPNPYSMLTYDDAMDYDTENKFEIFMNDSDDENASSTVSERTRQPKVSPVQRMLDRSERLTVGENGVELFVPEDGSEPEIRFPQKEFLIYESTRVKSFKTDSSVLKSTFPFKDAFIKAYDHLCDITSADFCEIESCVTGMLEDFMTDYGLMMYSHFEDFADCFSYLERALEYANKMTGARYDS